jgi:hypothetical protein
MIKTMLSTLRFRGACFQERRLDPDRIVAVLIRADREKPRPIAFDDLQIY